MSGSAPFRAWATINLQALQHNFAQAQALHPGCNMVALVKANAYGHGMLAVASALHPVMGAQDYFGVAALEEAVSLQRLNSGRAILLLEGVINAEEMAFAVTAGFHQVIHSLYQVDLLLDYLGDHPDTAANSLTLWPKIDTGMHRLGLSGDEFLVALAKLRDLPAVKQLILMTHLACADNLISPATQRQLTYFKKYLKQGKISLDGDGRNGEFQISVAASAGGLAWPQTHFQWLRPGIMLYGSSPIIKETGLERGLQPVMTLRSRIIAIRDVPAGDAIGYGATYVCAGNKRMGVVSIGYGDGYPRHAPNGTPVLVNCAANIIGKPRLTRLIGRVSMDMITIDLSDIREAAIGDEVILWGEGLSADEVSAQAGTVSYELFCKVTARVHFIYQ